jgi:hypothetical protein
MYSDIDIDSDRPFKRFVGYPVKTKTALARFSFNSESASVTVPEVVTLQSKGPCAYLRKAGDPNSLTSTTLTWKKPEGTANLPCVPIPVSEFTLLISSMVPGILLSHPSQSLPPTG